MTHSLLPLSPEWQKQADCIAPIYGQQAANSLMAMRARLCDLLSLMEKPLSPYDIHFLIDSLEGIDVELQTFDPPTHWKTGEPIPEGTPS